MGEHGLTPHRYKWYLQVIAIRIIVTRKSAHNPFYSQILYFFQVLCYSKFAYSKIRNDEWNEVAFFLNQSPETTPIKIFDVNWRWRHESSFSSRYINDLYGHITLPPILDMISYNEENFRWSGFIGNSEQNKVNRLLRDQIVTRLLSNLEDEENLMVDNERQLQNGILAEFDHSNLSEPRVQMDRLGKHFGTLREIPNPNNLIDVEVSLQASCETLTKFLGQKGDKMPRTTSYRGEDPEFFPYFWASIFKSNCDEEASLNLNRTGGDPRVVTPIQRYPDDSLIDETVDPPQCYAASLFPKDSKLHSIPLYAQSHGVCLGRNRTAALVSRVEYCQKVPAAPQGQRSCLTEGLPPCHECAR